MFKLLMLVALGVAGYMVAKRVMGRSDSIEDDEDFYGAADIHSTTDQPAVR